MEILGYFLAIVTGFTLGLIGGGGSILTVPILVYIFGISPTIATGYSLFIVGATALVGSVNYMRKGLMNYKAAVVFAIPSFMAVYLSRKYLVPNIPESLFSIGTMDITTDFFFLIVLLAILIGTTAIIVRKTVKKDSRFAKVFWLMIPAAIMVYVMRQFIIPALPDNLIVIGDFTLTKATAIMVLFAIIMVASAISMIRSGGKELPEEPESLNFNYPLIVIEGAVVGTITGVVGAGGGFLIIPALVLLAHLPMKLAVGTSLLIIAAKSLLGFLGDVSNHHIDWTFLLIFTGLAIVGIFLGGYATNYIPGKKLKAGFGYFVLLMGIYIIIQELILNQ
jgi:uncharacterized protein